MDLNIINEKFKENDQVLSMLETQKLENQRERELAAKSPEESVKPRTSKAGSGRSTPAFSQKSSVPKLRSQVSNVSMHEMHEEAETSKESSKVFPLPVAEMPNVRVFGYRDPLQDSPIRRAKEAIESGTSPLYRNMSKESNR